MARWYVLQGPHNDREGAKSVIEEMVSDGWEEARLRVIRLRDKASGRVAAPDASTGPSVAERLAALEADLLDLRTRVGDLEREPVASPAVASAAEDAAPGEPTNAELAERWDTAYREAPGSGITAWMNAARRALYNLGREHGRAERVAKDERANPAPSTTADPDRLAKVAHEEHRKAASARGLSVPEWRHTDSLSQDIYRAIAAAVAEANEAQPTPARDPLTDPQPGDYLLHEDGTIIAVRAMQPAQPERAVFDLLNKDRAPLRATPLTAAEFAERFDGHARPMTAAEVAAFKRDGTWPTGEREGT